MISVKEAQEIVFKHCMELDVVEEEVEFSPMLVGRILAEDIVATDPLPPFRASIMDG